MLPKHPKHEKTDAQVRHSADKDSVAKRTLSRELAAERAGTEARLRAAAENTAECETRVAQLAREKQSKIMWELGEERRRVNTFDTRMRKILCAAGAQGR